MSDGAPKAPPPPSVAPIGSGPTPPLGGGAPLPFPGPPPADKPLGPDERQLQRERIIEVLWDLQRERGWLDDEAVAIAARECGLTPLEVDEIAAFYNLLLRHPAGRTTIFVCDSISCELNGAPALIERLSERLGIAPGGVTADGAIGLLPIVCLGHCEKAPCLLAGETVHGPCALDRDGIERLLREITGGSGAAAGER